jgi:hypothetical protein
VAQPPPAHQLQAVLGHWLRLLRWSNVVGDAPDSFLTGTVGAAVDHVRGFGPMADDPAPTMGTGRCQLLDRAFKAIEDVSAPSGNDLEGKVILIAADFADCHKASLGWIGDSGRVSRGGQPDPSWMVAA